MLDFAQDFVSNGTQIGHFEKKHFDPKVLPPHSNHYGFMSKWTFQQDICFKVFCPRGHATVFRTASAINNHGSLYSSSPINCVKSLKSGKISRAPYRVTLVLQIKSNKLFNTSIPPSIYV